MSDQEEVEEIIGKVPLLPDEVPITDILPPDPLVTQSIPEEVEDIIVFNQQDFLNLQYAIQEIIAIERTHKNLGLPTIFAKFCDLSNLGLMITGPRGTGKTTVVRTIGAELPTLRHREYWNVGRLTPKGLGKAQSRFNKKSVSIYNLDFSSFSTEYLKDAALALFSSLIYDHEMVGETMGLSLSIEACYCSFISTIQPNLYRKISETDQFEAQYKDRYLRYYMLYFYPILEDQKFKVPQIIPLPHLVKRIPHIFEELPDIPISVKLSIEYKRFVQTLQTQTTPNRGREYAARLLKASALFNDREEVTVSDAKFLALYIPFLNIEFLLSERDNAAEPLKFDADAYTVFDYICTWGQVKPRQIEEHFQLRRTKHYEVDERKRKLNKTSLRHDTMKLRAKDMIIGKRIGVNSPPFFTVHPDYDFNYRIPVLRFLEKIQKYSGAIK